jgi:hypothetical protein
VLTAGAAFGLQAYVLKYLPIVDCLPYKKGSNISENLKIPEGSIPDSTVINFVYLKDGKEMEFDAESFPEDFNDSTYQFVKRYDKVVRIGNAQPHIKDFVIISQAGNDTTKAILEKEGRILVVFSKSLPKDTKKWGWADELRTLRDAALSKDIPIIWVSSDADNLAEGLATLGLQQMVVMKGDAVAIKTAARVDPSIYLLNKGTIEGKWSNADFSKVAAAF